ARWKWAAGIAACGPVGWAVVLLGAALGAWAGGATEGGEVLDQVGRNWTTGWAVLVAALAMGTAIGLTAMGRGDHATASGP
ncbi:MAG: hypothetical protein JRI25_21715, partial [Deltaproteobacteria bacterium]|nr:hypothetical protein [Deltaproteobacteria bacterium]